jgi:hypothetical protein
LEPSLPTGDDAGDQPAQEGLATRGHANLDLGVLAAARHRELEGRAAGALRVDEGSDAFVGALEAQQRSAPAGLEAASMQASGGSCRMSGRLVSSRGELMQLSCTLNSL